MYQIDDCEKPKNLFVDYKEDWQWDLLFNQTIENYGMYVLDENFDFESDRLKQKIPEGKKDLVIKFRSEYFRRQKLPG